MWRRVVSCCVVLCCTGLCCVALRCVALRCDVLCCVALSCVVLCCVVLYCVPFRCVVLCYMFYIGFKFLVLAGFFLSSTYVAYLNVKVEIKESKITTDVYCKETDTH